MHPISDIDSSQGNIKSNTPKLLLWSAGYLLSLFIWISIAAFIGMLGAPNHGGFGKGILDKIIVALHITYPITVLIILAIGWFLLFKGKDDLVFKVIWIPFIQGLLILTFFLVWFIVNV